jgi:hypothetical protein
MKIDKYDEALEPLLLTRQQVAQLLGGVDVSFVRRLEKSGRLKPIRLTRSPTAMVFHRKADVMALVEEAGDA